MKAGRLWLWNGLARLALVALFGVLLYQSQYRRVAHEDFAFDSGARTRFMGSLRAANGGKPFYFYFGDDPDPQSIDPAYLYPWGNTADDYGLHWLAVLTASGGKLLHGQGFIAQPRHVYQTFFALFIVTALVFVCPPIPLRVAAAGIFALSIGVLGGALVLSISPQKWGVGYMALLMGMFIGQALAPRPRWWAWCPLLGLGLLISFAHFIRQESLGIPYAGGAALLGAWALLLCVARLWPLEGLTWRMLWPSARRAGLAVLVLFVLIQAATPLMRLAYARAWDSPYSETRVKQHGTGLPLYVGLGYVDNPYNIAWLDLVGELHAQLYAPSVSRSHSDPAFQATLQTAWAEIMRQTPWLLAENLVAKAAFIHHFLWTGRPPYATAFLYTQQTLMLRLTYAGAWLVLLAGLGLLWRRGTPAQIALYLAMGGLLLGSLAGPLSGFPSYLSGAQGASLVWAVLVPVWLWHYAPNPFPILVRRLLMMSVGLALGFALLIGGVFAWRWTSYQNRLAEAQIEPNTHLERLEFRYAPLFNSLSDEGRQAVLAAFSEQKHLPVARPLVLPEDEHFVPLLALRTASQLHIIVRLAGEYPSPDPNPNQARVSTLIQVQADCGPALTSYDDDGQQTLFAIISDTTWGAGLRMFSLRVADGAFTSGEMGVNWQAIRGWGGGATNFGYQVATLSQTCLRFE